MYVYYCVQYPLCTCMSLYDIVCVPATTSPGRYECEVARNRKTQYSESFGGPRTLIPTIRTKCTDGEPDKVHMYVRTYVYVRSCRFVVKIVQLFMNMLVQQPR